jgi:hypothetical protein
LEQQIPFGNDSKKNKDKSKNSGRFPSEMTDRTAKAKREPGRLVWVREGEVGAVPLQ